MPLPELFARFSSRDWDLVRAAVRELADGEGRAVQVSVGYVDVGRGAGGMPFVSGWSGDAQGADPTFRKVVVRQWPGKGSTAYQGAVKGARWELFDPRGRSLGTFAGATEADAVVAWHRSRGLNSRVLRDGGASWVRHDQREVDRRAVDPEQTARIRAVKVG